MINILNMFNMSPDMLLCTLDITSLYTNIPHREGIQSIKEFLAIYRHTNTLLDNSYIVELLEVVLTNNCFDFNGKHYHQISGTAMGTKLAPSYAYLFMSKCEEHHLYTYHLQPTLWKRFIDDIFMIWPYGKNSLLEFIKHLNTVHPTITSAISPTEIAFLDLLIYIKGNELYIRLHNKDTDRHMYLNFNSEHPMSLKRSLAYSQCFRLNRICSEPHHLLQALIQLYWYFIWREYPHDTLIDAWRKTNQVTRERLLLYTGYNQDTNPLLMFITTYNSTNPNFRDLYQNIGLIWVGLVPPELDRQDIMITYRKPPSLKDMLVRAKIPQPRGTTHKGCTRPKTCKCCTRISQLGKTTNLNNSTTYNTITRGTCQSNKSHILFRMQLVTT